MRQSQITRKTAETDVRLDLCLEGGACEISTGVGFLDHMLTLFVRHGGFGLTLSCKGDPYVDDHHTVEDAGICLGLAFKEALGDLRGVARYGHIILPMDEALALCAVDLSGRGHLSFNLPVPTEKIGSFDSQLVEEFFAGFVRSAGITLHLQKLAGENSHHIVEAAFKAVARALSAAVRIDPEKASEIPSTKGLLV